MTGNQRIEAVTLKDVVESVLKTRQTVTSQRSILAAITGIDGSGKGLLRNNLLNH